MVEVVKHLGLDSGYKSRYNNGLIAKLMLGTEAYTLVGPSSKYCEEE
jgi:hypothetical protein